MELRQETQDDWWEVEALFDLAFAPGREALSSYRLRDGVDPVPELSLISRDDYGSVAGAVRVWPVQIEGAATLLLGPIAVHPTHQSEGLGAVLMGACLDRARALGFARVMLVGDLAYYRKFGFEVLDGITMPPPTNAARVLGVSLKDGAWDGVKGAVEKVSPQD